MRTSHSLVLAALAAAGLVGGVPDARAQCSISGPSIVCPDSAQLCASGGSEFQWTGPNGFTASTKCISVATPGTYSVRVFDGINGLWFGPCTQTLTAAPPESCGTQGGGGTPFLNCPRTASWWWHEVRADSARRDMSSADLAAVAACVDARSTLFSWHSLAGFGATLRWDDWFELREGTQSQFAAVLANLCAADAKLALNDGSHPGLGSATPLGNTTLGAWAQAADAQLVRLHGGSLRDSSVRNGYRRIYAIAWSVNHGVGVGATCSGPRKRVEPSAADATLPDVPGDDSAALPYSADLAAASTSSALFAPAPNPSRDASSMAFRIDDPAGSDVRLVVLDVSGRQLRVLASGRFDAGVHDVTWDGRGDDGGRVRAGVYFISGRIGGQAVSRSVLRLP